MKKNNTLWLLLLALCSIFAACKKDHPPKTELEKLPLITQTGANTFGCLLNGVAYTPGGGGVFGNVLSVQYDPTFQGGQFIIKTENTSNINSKRYVNLHADSISTVGIFQLAFKSKYWINYDAIQSNGCTYSNYYENPISGSLLITKFDTSNRIVSGTFDFKFNNANCGTIEATQGRFDVKY